MTACTCGHPTHHHRGGTGQCITVRVTHTPTPGTRTPCSCTAFEEKQ